MSGSPPAVLVVGGAGYIGAHTCKNLSANGVLPVTFDNFSTGHRDFVRFGPLVEGDKFNAGAVAEACRAWGVTAVIHFAASAYVAESIADPAKYYRNNVGGTLGLLEGMREASVRDIIFSSTCAVYGQPETVPIKESTPPHPVNPYGASKLMIKRILADYGVIARFVQNRTLSQNITGSEAFRNVRLWKVALRDAESDDFAFEILFQNASQRQLDFG